MSDRITTRKGEGREKMNMNIFFINFCVKCNNCITQNEVLICTKRNEEIKELIPAKECFVKRC